MSMIGTLDEVLVRTFELYIENRLTNESTFGYLLLLKHEDGSMVFDKEDVLKLIKMLQKYKLEALTV